MSARINSQARSRILRYTVPFSLGGNPVVTIPCRVGGMQLAAAREERRKPAGTGSAHRSTPRCTAMIRLDQICEAASGLSTRLVMLLTIDSNANFGSAESFFHAGSLRKTFHFASRSAESAKLSM